MADKNNSSEDNGDEEEIIATAVNIIRSEQILRYRDRIYEFVRNDIDLRSFVKIYSNSDESKDHIKYDLDILESDEEEVKIVEKGPEKPPFDEVKQNNRRIIELNLDAFNRKQKQKIRDKIESAYEQQGRLLSSEEEIKFDTIEKAQSDERNKEILNEFDQYISNTQKKLLRRCLSLRTAFESDQFIPTETITEWKNDLSNKFGDSAKTVANLCSSGYYDKDEILREIMTEVAKQNDEQYLIEEKYKNIIKNKPFVVYVGKMDSKEKINGMIRQKITQSSNYTYSVPFVDVRAQGYSNKTTAKNAIESFEQSVSGVNIDEMHTSEEYVYRIYPDSVKGMEYN